MTLAMWFWLFFVLWLLLSGWGAYLDPTQPVARWGRLGGLLPLLICLAILGVAQFGGPIK